MTPRLELRGITKAFPGVLANDNVSLQVMPGEIHAVLGENGAGKSTLMKIIYGALAADRGEILWNGEPVRIQSPTAARHLGIGMVYQHFSLFETVTVAENIAVAVDDPFDLSATSARVRELSERYGLPLDPDRLLHHLSVGERQRVEIVRCLLQHPRLLVLDEPTSVLTPQAVRSLFETLRLIAAEGCSVLYISHKLEEIRELCDTATILRGGAVAGTADPKTTSAEELASLMVGSALPETHREPARPDPTPRLEVRGLHTPAEDPFGTDLANVSLAVHSGEIRRHRRGLRKRADRARRPAERRTHPRIGRRDPARRRADRPPRCGRQAAARARLRPRRPPRPWRGAAHVAARERRPDGPCAERHGDGRHASTHPRGCLCPPGDRSLRRAVHGDGSNRPRPVRRQSSEVHRGARDRARTRRPCRLAADLGSRRRRHHLHPTESHRPEPRGGGSPRGLRRARRASRDLRPHRGALPGTPLRMPQSRRSERREPGAHDGGWGATSDSKGAPSAAASPADA